MDGGPKSSPTRPLRIVGRFALFGEIESGGFAAVHLGRAAGPAGFAKTVAIKRLHTQFAKDPDVMAMFLDEARVVARISHPNVVPTLDLVEEEGEHYIVMEYVEGVTLAHLFRKALRPDQHIPVNVVLRIMCGVLHGLHAAHEAKDERGRSLCLIHRDVAPDNILLGVDGHARLLDFGVARAMGRFHSTRDGRLKGKLAYMTPEQIQGEELTRQTDIFSASNVLWQALTGRRLFEGTHFPELAHRVLNQVIEPPSTVWTEVPKKLDAIVLRGLERSPAKRWTTAQKMGEALEAVGTLAPLSLTGDWIRKVAAQRLALRARQVAAVERAAVTVPLPPRHPKIKPATVPSAAPVVLEPVDLITADDSVDPTEQATTNDGETGHAEGAGAPEAAAAPEAPAAGRERQEEPTAAQTAPQEEPTAAQTAPQEEPTAAQSAPQEEPTAGTSQSEPAVRTENESKPLALPDAPTEPEPGAERGVGAAADEPRAGGFRTDAKATSRRVVGAIVLVAVVLVAVLLLLGIRGDEETPAGSSTESNKASAPTEPSAPAKASAPAEPVPSIDARLSSATPIATAGPSVPSVAQPTTTTPAATRSTSGSSAPTRPKTAPVTTKTSLYGQE